MKDVFTNDRHFRAARFTSDSFPGLWQIPFQLLSGLMFSPARFFWVVLPTVGSLLITLTSVVFWFRSYQSGDYLLRLSKDSTPFSDPLQTLESDQGIIRVGWGRTIHWGGKHSGFQWSSGPEATKNRPNWWQSWPEESFWNRLGFSASYAETGNFIGWENAWRFSAPWWSITSLSAACFALCFWRSSFAVRKKRKGYCSVCGYDLRATPNRCPECGNTPSQKIEILNGAPNDINVS